VTTEHSPFISLSYAATIEGHNMGYVHRRSHLVQRCRKLQGVQVSSQLHLLPSSLMQHHLNSLQQRAQQPPEHHG
jgi:hypothetical protein